MLRHYNLQFKAYYMGDIIMRPSGHGVVMLKIGWLEDASELQRYMTKIEVGKYYSMAILESFI